MSIESEFVTYEQALALKELGFNEYCLGGFCKIKSNWKFYIDEMGCDLLAPLKQQVFRWFREKYDAHIHPSRLMRNIYVVRYGDWDSTSFTTYEEAESACIDKLISISKGSELETFNN